MPGNIKLHMIGNAHIDPVWLWSWQEGFAEIKATFRSALDRLEEFPGFIFTCACAAYYKWVEENEPAMFEEIREKVKEGRWALAGGWWIQPDCNIPSGESFARHALYSQRYFKDRFGKIARVGYNVDSFGHNAMLPQLLKKSGMDGYVMLRPGEHEMHLPANLFIWESPDGTQIPAFRIHINYASWWGEPDPLFDKTRSVLELAREQGTDFMNFYGVGNHGGGPTIENILTIKKLQETEKGAEILFSSPDRFFDGINAQKLQFPVVREELQHHGSGCYSAHSETKAGNRRAEHRAVCAEKFAAVAHGLLGTEYPFEKLAESWEKLLFNQFHDIMGGCSVKEAYRDVREFFGKSLTESAEVLNSSLQKLSWAVDTMGDNSFRLSRDRDWALWETADTGAPVIVFNPLSWPVRQPVRLNRLVAGVADAAGKGVVIQKIRADRINSQDRWDTLFMADIPAMGYSTFWAHTANEAPCASPGELSADIGGTAQAGRAWAAMENEFLKVVISRETGGIASLYDKKACFEVFSGEGSHGAVIDESSLDTWGHNVKNHSEGVLIYDKIDGYFSCKSLKLMESGPLRAVVRSEGIYGKSSLRQDFILYPGKAELEVQVRLDWREEQRMLKLCFPVNVSEPKAIYEIPYGFIERPADGEEEPGQQWFDLSGLSRDTGGESGLAVINDSKYGCSCKENEMQLTVVRSPAYSTYEGEPDDFSEYMDLGIQEFRYMLVPHAGPHTDAGITRRAYEMNVPPVRVTETYHKGKLPLRLEGIAISSSSVIASAFKRAEDDDGYVLRLYETSGRTSTTGICLPFLGREWTAELGAFEIVTFMIPDETEKDVYKVNLLELQ